ncbi:cobyric acid synthase [Paenibacillus sp. J31TS4]|uniref:cobyric acid synthase n=1 Tax=Paenibacillus sp. J31TS4 TaxID=2807195 RepID=UPI001B156FE5|nr:cobyric acid synthase [Paenibacillus sp. J31TS4]GIP38778.1 cobyric acid synthase [Paenibacillus sp. J31TS4]
MEPKRPVARGRTIMLQGTASDVGKSVLTAALCRIFVQDGWRVAPFKSQNMSNNSYVTPDGREIGRAQGVQADACRIPATTDMNPILLKPKGEMTSQVVVHGRPLRDYDARSYRETYLPQAEGIVKEALARLRARCDIVVMEGAGSPAEVNLKDRDIVNMRAASWADAPVLLVGDIDRGGVFASLVGTMEILTPEERERVCGFVINKFRGDVSLLTPGLEWLEQKTGKPVLGVIPFLPRIGLEDEDSASLDGKLKQRAPRSAEALDIAVIRFARLSNVTDIDPLLEEDDVQVRFVSQLEEIGMPDAVILPGSKNTVDDLKLLKESGLADWIVAYARGGGSVVGLCGGYQMMGQRLLDTHFVESNVERIDGLGLFPTETVFTLDKRTEPAVGFADCWGAEQAFPIEGYEIHMGVTRFLSPVEHPFLLRRRKDGEWSDDFYPEGVLGEDGRLWGTYLHGVLHNDAFRRCWLNRLRTAKGWQAAEGTLRFREGREAAFDRLALHVREHLDVGRIYEMMGLAPVHQRETARMPDSTTRREGTR